VLLLQGEDAGQQLVHPGLRHGHLRPADVALLLEVLGQASQDGHGAHAHDGARFF
jgi:hypothetical protein